MFKNKKIKVILVILTLSFSSGMLFAVDEYISNIYKDIDNAFVAKDYGALNRILSKNNKDSKYYLIENYAQKKIRHLVVVNEYQFAMDSILVVIDNNLENETAVEMYSSIKGALEVQQKHEAEIEYKRQIEMARVEAAKESQRANVEKEYVSVQTSSGKQVYVSSKEIKLSRYSLKAMLGIVNGGFVMDSGSSIKSLHYGLSGDLRYKYEYENKAVLGFDIFAGGQFIGKSLGKGQNYVPLFGNFELDLKASPPFANKLFICSGFSAIVIGKDSNPGITEALQDTLYTPVVGIEAEQINLGPVRVDLGADWYAAHLFHDSLKFAMGANMNLAIPYAEVGRIRLTFNIGVRDKILVKETGLENRANFIFAIGVENAIK